MSGIGYAGQLIQVYSCMYIIYTSSSLSDPNFHGPAVTCGTRLRDKSNRTHITSE